MKRLNYTWAFVGAILLLTLGALASFREISALSLSEREDLSKRWLDDTAAPPRARPTPSFAEVAAVDEAWRRDSARHYSIAELRVRGDGRRTPRQALQDRVYSLTRQGNRTEAIATLERWVGSHPTDVNALLWLARLLNDAGRSKESIRRYRQALARAR